jgi:LPXTG-motif cell wall-anchored protein
MAENHCDNCLPTAVIVGIVIGVVSVVLMAMGLWMLWKRKKDISRRNATLGSIRMVTEDDVARFKMRDFGFEEEPVEVRTPPKRPKRPERVSKWVA